MFALALVFAFAACDSGNTTNEPPSNTSGDTSGDTSSDTSGDDVITLKFAHVAKLEHPTGASAEYFAERVAEESNGKLIIDVYPNRELGEEVQLCEMVQQGSVDIILSAESLYHKTH